MEYILDLTSDVPIEMQKANQDRAREEAWTATDPGANAAWRAAKAREDAAKAATKAAEAVKLQPASAPPKLETDSLADILKVKLNQDNQQKLESGKSGSPFTIIAVGGILLVGLYFYMKGKK